MNTITGYLIEWLINVTLARSPIPSQIPHTLSDIISLGVDAVLCHDQDTCMTVHTCARSKMPQYNIMKCLVIFPWTGLKEEFKQKHQHNKTNARYTLHSYCYDKFYISRETLIAYMYFIAEHNDDQSQEELRNIPRKTQTQQWKTCQITNKHKQFKSLNNSHTHIYIIVLMSY